MANNLKNIPLLLTCLCIIFCQAATSCDSRGKLSEKAIATGVDTPAQKEVVANNQQDLDEFIGAYTSVCKGDKNIFLTLDITKTSAGYMVTLKSFPGNYTIVTGTLKPDNTNFDPNLNVWAVTDTKNYTYGFVFNKKYLTELFSGCLVLDNTDYKPTISKCFIKDKQDNIVFCKKKNVK